METIKSKREFEQVFREGQRASHRLVRVTVLEDDGISTAVAPVSNGKLAFVAPRRLGTAVYRNRCKRVLREAARACKLSQPGRRVILFATRETYRCSPHELAAVLPGLVNRCVRSGGRGGDTR